MRVIYARDKEASLREIIKNLKLITQNDFCRIYKSVRIRDSGVQRSQRFSVVKDKDEAETEHSHHVSTQRQQEEEEVAVVSPANAVVHPGTVMVKVLRKGGSFLFRNFEKPIRRTLFSFLKP